MSTPRALADAWRQARRVVVLTGAGLSTASGIPDFRSPGGRWERYQTVPLPEFLASERAREAYWRYKGETWQLICAAEPNAAHAALADLARAGRIALLVTQRSEEHTSELQSPCNLVCRLLLEKKKEHRKITTQLLNPHHTNG